MTPIVPSVAPEPERAADLAPPVLTHDEYFRMTPHHSAEKLFTTTRLMGRAVRLLFSRQDPEHTRALAIELAASTSAFNNIDDPVRAWETTLQTDRGLGRARRLQRLTSSPVWHSDREHSASPGTKLPSSSAADYLFAATMNLMHQTPLSEELHIFRLWYIATRAAHPTDNALRLFGDLRELPAHQQLAAGARMLFTVESGLAHRGTPRAQLQAPDTVVRPPRE